MLVLFVSGEFLLHIPCWLHFYLGSFSYKSRAVQVYARSFSDALHAGFFFIWGVSLTHLMLVSFYIWGVSLTHPVLLSFFFYRRTFFYTSHAGFSYTSGAGFFRWKLLFFACPMLACLCWEFILHILCWLLDVGSFYNIRCAWCFMWGVSLTHPLLSSLCGEFLLHILCWLPYVGSFSYTSCASFFLWEVSLTCTVLASSCGEFLLHIPCWPLYVGYFSSISM